MGEKTRKINLARAGLGAGDRRAGPSAAARVFSGPAFSFSPLFFLLLFLLPLSSAAGPGPFDSTLSCFGQTYTMVADFDQPIILVMLIMGALIAMAYMLSQGLEKPELSVWAKSELITLGFSLLLIIGVVGMFGVSCDISNRMLFSDSREFADASVVGPSGTNLLLSPAARATQYIDKLSQTYGLTLATDLTRSAVQDQFGSMAYAYWSVPVLDGGGLAFKANKRAWAAQKDMLIDLYMPMMISLQVQKFFINLAMTGVLTILLPAALLLRTFFFSRDIGNLLIALSFSIFFALPVVYSFGYEASANLNHQLCPGGCDPLNPFGQLNVAYDKVVGDTYQRIGFVSTQAVLIPNLALVVMVTMTMALNKALRGFAG